MKVKLPSWTDVYPHGTREGDEELKFFIALARNPKFQWRSTSALAKESGLSKERVEEIIQKYHKKGMIFQNPKNDEQWGYHARVPDMVPDVQDSIAGKDQCGRVKKVVAKDLYSMAVDWSVENPDNSAFVSGFSTGTTWRDLSYDWVELKQWNELEELKIQALSQNPQIMGVPK